MRDDLILRLPKSKAYSGLPSPEISDSLTHDNMLEVAAKHISVSAVRPGAPKHQQVGLGRGQRLKQGRIGTTRNLKAQGLDTETLYSAPDRDLSRNPVA